MGEKIVNAMETTLKTNRFIPTPYPLLQIFKGGAQACKPFTLDRAFSSAQDGSVCTYLR